MNQTIYVRLIDEGVDVWRPALAKKGQTKNSFWILAPPFNIVPEGETWEFEPGSHVLVKETLLDGEIVNVAYEKVGN